MAAPAVVRVQLSEAVSQSVIRRAECCELSDGVRCACLARSSMYSSVLVGGAAVDAFVQRASLTADKGVIEAVQLGLGDPASLVMVSHARTSAGVAHALVHRVQSARQGNEVHTACGPMNHQLLGRMHESTASVHRDTSGSQRERACMLSWAALPVRRPLTGLCFTAPQRMAALASTVCLWRSVKTQQRPGLRRRTPLPCAPSL